MEAQPPDLFVVCKSCGSEVSPYITECPYCGTRLRKRAPKLDKGGVPKPPKPPRKPRLGRLRNNEIPGIRADRPWATIVLVVLPFVLLPIVLTILYRADASFAFDMPLLGQLEGEFDGDYHRLITYTLIYPSTGYEIVGVGAIALFAFLLERRHGFWAPLIVFVVAAVAGAELALAVEDQPLASGGNGAALGLLAAWTVWELLERRRGNETDGDLLGVLVIALVLILLPLADDWANWWVMVGGGASGLALGLPLAWLKR